MPDRRARRRMWPCSTTTTAGARSFSYEGSGSWTITPSAASSFRVPRDRRGRERRQDAHGTCSRPERTRRRRCCPFSSARTRLLFRLALVRRSAYEAVGAEYLEILFNDHEMWLRLAANADVGILDGWDADYRVHVGQTSFMGRLELAEKQFEVLDAVKGLPISEKFRRRARARRTCAALST